MQVFISHSSHDKDFASRLCNDLILYDIEVWFDEWSIRPGDSIPGAIEIGLRGSDYVLLLISRSAIDSNWVTEELNSTLYSSLSVGKPKLVPLLLEKLSLPTMLQHRKNLDFSIPDKYENALNSLVTFLFQEYPKPSHPQPLIPGFREVRLLGEGGFSTVYKAIDAKTFAIKAIKVPKSRHRLQPEVAVVKKLEEHPGIVPIERTLTYKDRVLLVMPYAGYSLKWFLDHRKISPKQLDQIITWMKKLFETLIFAHSKQIIHQDIKPGNILIDEFGDLRVTDFGIAQKIQYAEFQQSTIVRGTLCYMSPEQQLADRVTPQTDIYSCGAVFYELVTSEKPVGRFRNPRYYNPDLSVRLERIIEKCLERDLSDRYKTASEILDELESLSKSKGNLKSNSDQIFHTKIIGESLVFKKVIDEARLMAQISETVLITGETGTGKELVAHLIYQEYAKSVRYNMPFIVLSVPFIPSVLIESELFGHVKGAFTGATGDRKGLFELANGGVLFIDEIGELDLTSQARLLRVLEMQAVRPLGSSRSIKLQVKVIAATNKSLGQMLEARTFRADLYHRINSFCLHLPPLRERKEDIPFLIDYFINQFIDRYELKQPIRISDDAMDLLTNYSWSGNIRELKAMIERLIIIHPSEKGGIIQVDDLDPIIVEQGNINPVGIPTLAETRKLAEKEAVESALKYAKGDFAEAARMLGISLRYLKTLMKNIKIREQDLT